MDNKDVLFISHYSPFLQTMLMIQTFFLKFFGGMVYFCFISVLFLACLGLNSISFLSKYFK